jgi:hypothetical protein
MLIARRSVVSLDKYEEFILQSIRDNLPRWAKRRKKPPVISRLVFYVSDNMCDLVHINVPVLMGKNEEEIAKLELPDSGAWLEGLKHEKHYFQVDVDEYRTSDDSRIPVERFMYRICARLEETKDLGAGVEVAPDLSAFIVMHEEEGPPDLKLRRIARQWLQKPADEYMRSFGKLLKEPKPKMTIEKVAPLGFKADERYTYRLNKDGDIVRVRDKLKRNGEVDYSNFVAPDEPGGKWEKVAPSSIKPEEGYVYFVDLDGDIARHMNPSHPRWNS